MANKRWHRLSSGGSWSPLIIYRLNSSGVWNQLNKIYRLASDGVWKLVHYVQNLPTAIISPTLTNQSSISTEFFGGDTLTLTRGQYTNTTNNSNTSYRMTIYKGNDQNLSVNDTNWIPEIRQTFTGDNSTQNTTITYNLTDSDAELGYYLVGEVKVDNDVATADSEK